MDSYEFDMRTWFKKFYCSKCGGKLKKIRHKRKMTEEEIYESQLAFHWMIPISKPKAINMELFLCSNCGSSISIEKQLLIRKKQKELKRNILTEEELESLK